MIEKLLGNISDNMIGMKCLKCGKGKYGQPSISYDYSGTCVCNKCGNEVSVALETELNHKMFLKSKEGKKQASEIRKKKKALIAKIELLEKDLSIAKQELLAIDSPLSRL